VTPEARVRFVSGHDSAPPAGTEAELDLGIEFLLAPGWHVYWKNSGDAGYAPKLDLSATAAISNARLLFPAPHRFDLPGGLVSFGYEREVIYPVSGTLRPTSDGPIAIRGRLDYLACATECIPLAADLELDLPDSAGATGPSDEKARLELWRNRLPRTPGSAGAPVVELALERGHPKSTLVVTASGGDFRASSPDLFFESHDRFALGRPELSIGSGGLTFRVPVHPLDETKPFPESTDFAWTLTGLEGNDGPYALEGVSQVGVPSPVAPLRRFWFVGLLALPLLWLAVHRIRRSRDRSDDPSDRGTRTQPA
jgi:suppressor for copper-sensitivity B